MTKQLIEYTKNYTSFTREELIEEVRRRLSDKRFKHVLRVEEMALELAEMYAVDAERVSVAALLHDVAKEESSSEMLDLIISENLDLDLLQYGPQIWHAPVGAVQARREFAVEDEAILNAINYHTIGATDMGDVEKVIFIADYIERGRTFDGVKKARQLANESLDDAIRFKIKETILQLTKQEQKIYPKAIDSYNAWIPE